MTVFCITLFCVRYLCQPPLESRNPTFHLQTEACL